MCQCHCIVFRNRRVLEIERGLRVLGRSLAGGWGGLQQLVQVVEAEGATRHIDAASLGQRCREGRQLTPACNHALSDQGSLNVSLYHAPETASQSKSFAVQQMQILQITGLELQERCMRAAGLLLLMYCSPPQQTGTELLAYFGVAFQWQLHFMLTHLIE